MAGLQLRLRLPTSSGPPLAAEATASRLRARRNVQLSETAGVALFARDPWLRRCLRRWRAEGPRLCIVGDTSAHGARIGRRRALVHVIDRWHALSAVRRAQEAAALRDVFEFRLSVLMGDRFASTVRGWRASPRPLCRCTRTP